MEGEPREVVSAIQQAKTFRALATILAAGVAAMAHDRVAADKKSDVIPLTDKCIAKAVEGSGGRGHRVGGFFHGLRGVGGCTVGTKGGKMHTTGAIPSSIHFQDMGGREKVEKPLLLHQKVTDRAPQKDGLEFDPDTKNMTIRLPSKKARALQDLLEERPEGKRMATVRQELVSVKNLHRVACVI